MSFVGFSGLHLPSYNRKVLLCPSYLVSGDLNSEPHTLEPFFFVATQLSLLHFESDVLDPLMFSMFGS